MTRLTRPAEISGVSAGSFPETAAGNRAYLMRDESSVRYECFQIQWSSPETFNKLKPKLFDFFSATFG